MASNAKKNLIFHSFKERISEKRHTLSWKVWRNFWYLIIKMAEKISGQKIMWVVEEEIITEYTADISVCSEDDEWYFAHLLKNSKRCFQLFRNAPVRKNLLQTFHNKYWVYCSAKLDKNRNTLVKSEHTVCWRRSSAVLVCSDAKLALFCSNQLTLLFLLHRLCCYSPCCQQKQFQGFDSCALPKHHMNSISQRYLMQGLIVFIYYQRVHCILHFISSFWCVYHSSRCYKNIFLIHRMRHFRRFLQLTDIFGAIAFVRASSLDTCQSMWHRRKRLCWT